MLFEFKLKRTYQRFLGQFKKDQMNYEAKIKGVHLFLYSKSQHTR